MCENTSTSTGRRVMIRRKRDMTSKDKPAGGTQDPGTPGQGTPDPRTPDPGTPGRGTSDPGALPDRPTINDIARYAAVSKKTVSRVLNKSPFVATETREKIEAIIARTSYSPDPQARGLAFRRSFLVGIVFDNPNPQYVVNMQQGILH